MAKPSSVSPNTICPNGGSGLQFQERLVTVQYINRLRRLFINRFSKVEAVHC
jgi:hypothetical protein